MSRTIDSIPEFVVEVCDSRKDNIGLVVKLSRSGS